MKILPVTHTFFRNSIYKVRKRRRNYFKGSKSLFVEKFSDGSGLVRDVKTAESILREFETATTTKYCSKCVPTIPHKICKGFNATWLCPKCQRALEKEEASKPVYFIRTFFKEKFYHFSFPL